MSELPRKSEMDEVRDILQRIMGDKSPEEWLNTPNKAYGGLRPIDILYGNDRELRAEFMETLRDFDRSISHENNRR